MWMAFCPGDHSYMEKSSYVPSTSTYITSSGKNLSIMFQLFFACIASISPTLFNAYSLGAACNIANQDFNKLSEDEVKKAKAEMDKSIYVCICI